MAPDLDERIETYYARVRGTVQGVGFRLATVRQAHALGIKGWVANRDDGSVEAMLQGPANQIDRMLSWLRHGPPRGARDRSERRGAPHGQALRPLRAALSSSRAS
ncbi:acylphosphatase [Paraburkholderia sp. WSM4179]|nr:acylphosphatase [Paraburkholderia sp. WSM4179]